MKADHTNILIELNRAVKTLHFYPKGHPNLDRVLSQFYSLLKDATKENGEIKWKIDAKGIFEADKPIAPKHAATTALAKQLFLRKVNSITFLPSMTSDDIKGFLKILTMEPQEIFAQGGAVAVLARNGTTGILLNETTYEELVELKKRMEEEERLREACDGQEHAEGGVQPEEAARPENEAEAREESPPEAEEEPSLASLLKLLAKETDTIRYNDLSSRVAEKVQGLMEGGLYDEALPALLLFLKHTLARYVQKAEIRKRAWECLAPFLTRDLILHLIKRIGERDEPNRPAIQYMLLKAGDEAVGLLLDALVETTEAHARRQIFNTLVRFGERIRPYIEDRLDHGEWYAARQMVALLGELGGEASLDALERAYAMDDVRVKKEVLKSLGRIPSERSSRILVSAIRDGERALMGQAIISLGMLKDSSSVDLLGEIAVKKETFSDNLELKKEAVKALGITGDKRAVPYLKKVLSRKAWFGKGANENLRTLAVLSLGKIGGQEALEAVREVYRDSTGNLYNICRRILEGSGK